MPDLTALGKVIGGGLPVGAFGGRAEIMDHAFAGRTCLSSRDILWQPDRHGGGSGANPTTHHSEVDGHVWKNWEQSSKKGCAQLSRESHSPFIALVPCSASISAKVLFAISQMPAGATKRPFRGIFMPALNAGVYFAPSQFEAGFLSLAHTEADIERSAQWPLRRSRLPVVLAPKNRALGTPPKHSAQGDFAHWTSGINFPSGIAVNHRVRTRAKFSSKAITSSSSRVSPMAPFAPDADGYYVGPPGEGSC